MSEHLQPASGQFGADKAHRLPVRVYYEDTDFSGVVYHARYLHFFERGRTESLRACGIHHSELAAMEPPLAFAVRRMGIEFIRAARVDDVLVVETRFKPQAGARLMMDQALTRDGETIATASVQAVCIDGAGRAKRPPEWMQKQWQDFVLTTVSE
ncbi:tol-pal system-associated acyl-CoA thioesterase [Maricaulis sp.]|jgi:acyl-CoA thioester hydrolase|uniref:tol-pal system-associated acyl-CoA thioesterase n=1 Tax=Maricaulis sp. TaxID=1486257 RepID=UPI0025EBA75C|nr:tol-pal system-associated acyl-CoA thioesterase [Maricaulis sp.]MDF1769324.1 tol-pal system-associated acyl-CoA thioesterase [Maricaulis sp.]